MMQALRLFLNRPTTKVGIVTAFMFQIIFAVIWMTAYDGVTDRTSQLRIAIVNEDGQLGKQLSGKLAEELPFETVVVTDLGEAQAGLNNRDYQMVMHIPADFTQKAASADATGSIEYWINESNPALIKSIMSGAAAQITGEINSQAVASGVQAALSGAQMPAEQAAAAAASLSERVTADIRSVNPVQGMNNQMVPMMMVLASFVGAMIMGMNFQQSTMAVQAQAGKWNTVLVKAVLNAVSAVLVALVGTSLVALLGGQFEQGFLHMWLFQSLFLLTFMFVSQMFLSLFGLAGMLFNIMLLSVQLVSSGAIVPRELLSDFYTGLGRLLPATYAVDGNMNILFGGGPITGDCAALLLIMATAMAVTAVAVAFKKQGAKAALPAQIPASEAR
ncbi:YhgE/Pip domain-containing protein [Paenibacillus thailandensis]|uniref:YhgE/Pip domain-containing protein n=1 Tax=Paenibacillus thailandensis TaxID=393250 RepID=A0ABW5QUV7_9BACL